MQIFKALVVSVILHGASAAVINLVPHKPQSFPDNVLENPKQPACIAQGGRCGANVSCCSYHCDIHTLVSQKGLLSTVRFAC